MYIFLKLFNRQNYFYLIQKVWLFVLLLKFIKGIVLTLFNNLNMTTRTKIQCLKFYFIKNVVAHEFIMYHI